MDTNTSGEELLTKARKPYTITKQRERWTEDEHERFLEALRLYGRAWQRIEEHIGTKTAVQIRSHAQKFFTKLEKEAETKGIPVCQALDIEIPPPRPKRKPNTPYPRKPGNNGTSSSQVSSAKDAKLVSSASSSQCNHAFLDLEKMPVSEKTSTGKENQDDNCSGVSTMNKYPLPKKVTQRKGNADIETSKTSTVDNAVQDVPKKNKDKDGNDGTVHSLQNYPWHFHADIVNGNITKCPQNHPSACHSQDDYRSFLQMSSTFSNLIMSTLLQNPAAHAAATFAASVWPCASVGNSGDSSTPVSSSPPNVAAIAAATVAAATAWWASHGLLPVCAPAPLTCVPLPTVVPTPAMTEMDTDENAQLPLEKQNTALQDPKLASKSPASSSDDSEETGVTNVNAASKANGDKVEEVVVTAAAHDSNVTKKKNLVDRSSCGSNTPSGSDVETDALDKMEKDNEDVKEADENQPDVNELNNRKTKLRDNNNPATDSWKEVSEEGRMAFQALFARERLPQSFSPPLVAENVNGKQIGTSMPLALNFKVQDSRDADQERVVMIGVGPGKSLKTRQTGFKPYKRCSMELKESQGDTNNQSDEKVCKRLRLEGEAST
ncbi:protein LHY isoform X2 [Capsella rubella]|uniref:protein LHY isoform X2 n=1 Tax=Capsella rubella TaxID=81985 RepID=UPI000CD510EC|nr:protein LHY isoform X2 [Capsella rubella]